jgi:predicted permease
LILNTIIKAPFFIAIVVGMLLFLTQMPIPGQIMKTIGFLTNLNTPLAMFTVGNYLAQTNIAKMFKRKQNYLISFVRLVIIPLVSLLILYFVPGCEIGCYKAERRFY